MKQLVAFVEGMRPRQWVKNLIIFLGVIFARQMGDGHHMLRALAAFAVFCMLSGCIYHFNDRMDRERDRLHPKKKDRPLASGRLSEGFLYVGLTILVALSLLFSWKLGTNFLILAVVFLCLNILYSVWMKHLVLLDAFGIAINFVLRAVAGVAVLAPQMVTDFEGAGTADVTESVLLSPWLLICTFFGSLFLAFAKRRHELLTLDDPGKHRRVLQQYSPKFLDHLVSLSAGTVIMSYALYTLWPSTVSRYGMGFLASNLFVTYGVMRYLYVVYFLDRGGDPSEVLLKDRPIKVVALIWLVFTAWRVGSQ